MRYAGILDRLRAHRFNEAAGADPADARLSNMQRLIGGGACFNEAAGADPADAPGGAAPGGGHWGRFNEAAGADPADAPKDWPLADDVVRLQ